MTEKPLFVDLDGTLIKSDLLLETFIALTKQNPLRAFIAPVWLMRGKAHMKQRIADHVEFEAGSLPYNEKFLSYLRTEAASGRQLVLATASDEKLARKVAAHLGIFTDVLASDGAHNMSGATKLEAIRKTSPDGFDYAGNAKVDLDIFPHAERAILVNPERGVEAAARRVSRVAEVFEDRRSELVSYIKAIRVHQWLKNLLLLVPLLTIQDWHGGRFFLDVLLGIVSFSLCASSVYLLNDMLDLQSDRAHPRKRFRPFAAGDVSLASGAVLMFALLAAGLIAALALPWAFLAVLGAYLTFTLAYSLHLKAYVLIDVMLLAGLYTLRIIAGAAAIGEVPSFWLLAFSMCIFVSLALIKRCSELVTLMREGRPDAPGRDYHRGDLDSLTSMGTASGFLAVLVLALFVNTPEVATRYSSPKALWFLCPLILYWISRLWLKTGRGEMHDDPIVFTLKDRGSRYVAVACAVTVLLAARGIFVA